MVRMIDLKHADTAHETGAMPTGPEPLRRKCAYAEAIGACALLVALAVVLV